MRLRAVTSTPQSWRPPPRSRWRRGAAAALVLSLPALGVFARERDADAVDQALLELRIKAAVLFHFSHFIEWPREAFPAADTPFRIGVLGQDPFGDVLDRTVAGKTAMGRNFEIKRSGRVEALADSHIVFVSQSEKERLREILDAFRDRPVVTVSDLDQFAEEGGLFGFTTADSVGLKMNLEVEEASRLKVASKLKRLCVPVRTRRGAPR